MDIPFFLRSLTTWNSLAVSLSVRELVGSSKIRSLQLSEKICKKAASDVGVDVKEGVYAFTQGPMYETPAEIRALGILGADAVGMSTVPEVIAARHANMNILGISCITNMAAGILDQPLTHEEVMKTAKEAENKFVRLVKRVISVWEV